MVPHVSQGKVVLMENRTGENDTQEHTQIVGSSSMVQHGIVYLIMVKALIFVVKNICIGSKIIISCIGSKIISKIIINKKIISFPLLESRFWIFFIIAYSYQFDYISGEMIVVDCEKNYEFPSNNVAVTCNNGTWTQIPRCQPAR